MENSQSVQHESTQMTGPTLELTNSKSGLIGGSNIFIYLLTQHPLLLLTGLLTMLLGSAALALYSLGYAGNAEQVEPEEIPAVVENPIKTPSETSNPTPLWMVIAIALSCGSGCLVILRLLNRPTQHQKVRKQINRYPTRVTPSRPQRLEPQTLKNPPVFVPLQPLKPFVSMQAKTKPLVTVLPPEHRHPLDKSKESLADLMDIRKQNSLSSILRSS
ncbi:hypothetical protein A6770_25695 [Nostoc minutum NIES-26]|uniref:Transmembrane protein n=1 Tax=Nostoc minutum NIES-26 TaxID=1844469 RepID=A0A367QTJ8_9NOSO|nr:hypothetical protein A6770_25695 [Nostoc minutum NIES-26]